MNTFEAIHGGKNHRLWIGGHRGHASATHENTTANFAEVLGMGVDYIEIDVQLTRDRQAVIFHDMALEERTPLHGHISRNARLWPQHARMRNDPHHTAPAHRP